MRGDMAWQNRLGAILDAKAKKKLGKEKKAGKKRSGGGEEEEERLLLLHVTRDFPAAQSWAKFCHVIEKKHSVFLG